MACRQCCWQQTGNSPEISRKSVKVRITNLLSLSCFHIQQFKLHFTIGTDRAFITKRNFHCLVSPGEIKQFYLIFPGKGRSRIVYFYTCPYCNIYGCTGNTGFLFGNKLGEKNYCRMEGSTGRNGIGGSQLYCQFPLRCRRNGNIAPGKSLIQL